MLDDVINTGNIIGFNGCMNRNGIAIKYQYGVYYICILYNSVRACLDNFTVSIECCIAASFPSMSPLVFHVPDDNVY